MTGAAREALVLRRRALELLADGVRTAGDGDVSERGWRLFLATERCAVPLLSDWSGDAPDALRDRAARETARILASRAQADALGGEAARRGLRPILLKGAVELFDGPGLAIGDLDVLVEPSELAPMREAARDLGYEIREHGHGTRHEPAYELAGGVPLELHGSIDAHGAPAAPELFEGVEPIPDAVLGLFRLAPADHAWHVLLHGTVDHYHRRGRIRDVLLLARALGRLSAGQREDFRERAARHAWARPLLAQLRMAEALRAGRTCPDEFRAEAAALYLAYGALRRSRAAATLLLPTAADAPAALLSDGPELTELWRETGRFADGRSIFEPLAGVERRMPRVGRGVRRFGRIVRLLASLAGAAILRPVARRLAAGS